MRNSGWVLPGVALGLSGLAGCAQKIPAMSPSEKPQISQKLPKDALRQQNVSEATLKTSDGWSILGKLYLPSGFSKGGVVLLHQRGGTGEDWKPLCESLQGAGYTALAIDQRGAGRSTAGPGPTGENAPWDTMGDISAAIEKMKSYGLITLIGASYGANNALLYASAHPEQVSKVVLLSPGENYHGLEALPAAKTYSGSMLILTDHGDTIAADGPAKINDAAKQAKHNYIEYDGDGHGTELLRGKSVQDILDFLNKN